MTVELPYDIGTEVYYACAWGVESGVISHYEILKDVIYAYDKGGFLLSNIQDLHNNYDDAYEEFEDRFGNVKESEIIDK